MVDTLYITPETGGETLPPDFDVIEPGPVLAVYLTAIDPYDVSGHERVLLLRAYDRMASFFAAQRAKTMVAIADALEDVEEFRYSDRAMVEEEAAEEVRAALHLTRRAAEMEMTFALSLRKRLPRLAEMLASGAVDVRRARTIEANLLHLPISVARAVLDDIAGQAPELTTGQLGGLIRRRTMAVEPEDAKLRYDRSIADRRVVVEPTTDGSAHLSGYDLPADRVAGVSRRINEIARGLRSADEQRTMDQLRADVYLDLLEGNDHGAGRAVVDIVVPIDTLTERTDQPGEIPGFGPIIADVARKVVDDQHDAEWRVTVEDEDGEPTHVVTTRRRPTAAQRRRVQVRDRTCVFPGCRQPAIGSDIDHTKAVADGGATADPNLGPLCRHDHCVKHRFGWSYERGDDGRYRWTSPLGHRYVTAVPGRSPP